MYAFMNLKLETIIVNIITLLCHRDNTDTGPKLRSFDVLYRSMTLTLLDLSNATVFLFILVGVHLNIGPSFPLLYPDRVALVRQSPHINSL